MAPAGSPWNWRNGWNKNQKREITRIPVTAFRILTIISGDVLNLKSVNERGDIYADVRYVTFNLLRKLDLRIIVGNPGSTEKTFLKNFPDDFTYILALHEASVVGIANGLSQGLKKPVIINVHTGAGMGNAMGCILSLYVNKTPLIITAGQQTRDMLLSDRL